MSASGTDARASMASQQLPPPADGADIRDRPPVPGRAASTAPNRIELGALLAVGAGAWAWMVVNILAGVVASRLFAHAPPRGTVIERATAGQLFGDILVHASAIGTGCLAVIMGGAAVYAAARVWRGGGKRSIIAVCGAAAALLVIHLMAWGAIAGALSYASRGETETTAFAALHGLSTRLVQAETIVAVLLAATAAWLLLRGIARRRPAA